MKKSLVLLFAMLLTASLCYAEQAPITATGDQAKITENKEKDVTKKSVKPTVKKSGKSKRVKKAKESTKKEEKGN